jgi:hypothetical protein
MLKVKKVGKMEGQDETRNSETNSVRIYAMSQAYYLVEEINGGEV